MQQLPPSPADVAYAPYLLTRSPLHATASASRRFSSVTKEAMWHRLGNLLMSLDTWRLYGDRRTELPVLDYDVVVHGMSE